MQNNHHTLVSAAIDIGSNTIRIVIARYQAGKLDVLAADEALVRIGESVNATGVISPEKLNECVSVLRGFIELAKRYHAQPILAVATEAIRKATNRDDFVAKLERSIGIKVQYIDGKSEAMLTFYGVTSLLTPTDGSSMEPFAVMDLGGGSTELILAQGKRITWHASFPVGSGWLHDRYFFSDPANVDDIAVARAFLQTYFDGIDHFPSSQALFVTGGTANTLLLLAQRAFRLDTESRVLTLNDVMRCEALLMSLSAHEISERYTIEVKRAQILIAGALIIHVFMEHYDIKEFTATLEGIREGILIAHGRYGGRWLQQVQGEEQESSDLIEQQHLEGTDIATEPFYQSGSRILHERAEKMVAWRDDVLVASDIEAIHKMRVASRRLRAAMDAYRDICVPKVFNKAYRHVKLLADLLGAVRDIDVIIEHVKAEPNHLTEEEFQGVHWFVSQMNEYRTQKQEELKKALLGFKPNDFLHDIDACLPGGLKNG